MTQMDQWSELQQKVNFLREAASYKDGTKVVEVVETHLSWVFLTNHFAYKLKKPHHFPFLKLDSLDDRLKNAKMELVTNQQLAPTFYISIIPLTRDQQGRLYLEEASKDAKVVDWLIKMKRFPKEATLDQKILKNVPIGPQLETAIKLLSSFYLNAKPEPIDADEYVERFKVQIEEDAQSLSNSSYQLDCYLIAELRKKLLSFIENHSEILRNRVKGAKIVEGHGDLRPEHICLTELPVIIDRLEFSKDLRVIDPIDELGYLSLECALLGDEQIEKRIFSCYLELTQDYAPDMLKSFYQGCRATLRAKICAWHLDDERIPEKDKWKIKAQRYLSFAKKILG